MIQKKICLLGAFSVGKTSLIKRYVNSLFNDKYHTTVGVKIDKKQININNHILSLMIWDLAGEDAYTEIRSAYLRGLSGCIIVIDGTRMHSFEVAMTLYDRVRSEVGAIPVVFALNKTDLAPKWELKEGDMRTLHSLSGEVIKTSAKSGEQVNNLFTALAKNILVQEHRNVCHSL